MREAPRTRCREKTQAMGIPARWHAAKCPYRLRHGPDTGRSTAPGICGVGRYPGRRLGPMIAFPGRMRRTHLLQDTTPHDRNQWLHESSDRTGKGMRQASRPDACTSTGAPGTFRRGVARHRSSLPDRATVAGAAQVRRQDCLPRSPRLHARMQTADALLLPVELQGKEVSCEHQPSYSTGSGKNFPCGSSCCGQASSCWSGWGGWGWSNSPSACSRRSCGTRIAQSGRSR